MLNGQRIVCVLPAYNAEKTLEKTLRDVPEGIVDRFILVDDCSKDETAKTARSLMDAWPIRVIQHEKNLGYGGNQKTCYQAALNEGADIVVMLHPDYQYEPKLLGALVWMIASGVYDIGLGSRILGKGALSGGMPIWKYVANRLLTFVENLLIGQKLSEYHTGYRAYSAQVLKTLPLDSFSDDFVFDNEFLVMANSMGFRMGEVSVPTKYFPEASSINFARSVKYGLGVLRCSWWGLRMRMSGSKSLQNPNPAQYQTA
ncbi:MAG: glycosyltransferase family 2 protein [Proteobacteria bacterium]|nr:glycosyltransferase family 2 protein [Pseudomonadota bacterium]NDC23248.1 glycosyltransferase family 2 protein [Pseudomonadota bacterium]NDD03470.1 glycosyltransferase family 2 protein [Pseudomonadota bacterium]NDG25804.1 glycosyltransferase family 2 protein [Pseudomonadota bacterium]